MIALWVASALGLAGVAAERAVSGTRRSAASRRLVGDPESARTRTDLDPRAMAVVLAGGVTGWVVGQGIGAVLGVAAAMGLRRIQASRMSTVSPAMHQERFADAVGSMTAAVRAGLSLPQAIGYAAQESEPPVCEDLRLLVAALEVGVPLEAAVDVWAARVATADADLVAGALDLHRRSGGDLPAVLDQVTATIRDRVGVAREVRTLTAQARLSAWILGLLPIGFFGFLWLTARSDIEGALATPVGIVCVVVGLCLELGAFLWIRTLLVVG